LDRAVDGLDNTISDREAEARERALFYVALTRARKSAFVTSCSEASPFLAL